MKVRLDVILDLDDASREEVDGIICDIVDGMWDYATDVDIIDREIID